MTEHTHGADVLGPLAAEGRALRHAIPEVYRGFAAFDAAAFAPGALESGTKELVALGVAITLRCDGCIAAHARRAVAAGVTREEAAEAIGAAMVLNGGPGTVYGPRAYDAFCEYIEAHEAKQAAGGSSAGPDPA